MKNKIISLCLLFLLVSGLSVLHAQEANVAAGGNATGSGGNVSYSVGQIVYTTNSSAEGVVSQGIQQTYFVSVGIDNSELISLATSVYPNPTSGSFILSVKGDSYNGFKYQLYDVNGKLLKNENINNSETAIGLEQYPTSTYYLLVYENNNTIKSFKILKTR